MTAPRTATPRHATPALRATTRPLVDHLVRAHAYADGEQRDAAWSEVGSGRAAFWNPVGRIASTADRLGGRLHLLDLHAVRAREARERLGRATGDVIVVNHGRGEGVMREVTHEHFAGRSAYVLLGEGPLDGGIPGTSVFVREAFGEALRDALEQPRKPGRPGTGRPDPGGDPTQPGESASGTVRRPGWGWIALLSYLTLWLLLTRLDACFGC